MKVAVYNTCIQIHTYTYTHTYTQTTLKDETSYSDYIQPKQKQMPCNATANEI